MPLMKEFVNVIARDGTSLSATWYITDVPQDIVVLIAPATGVKQTYYTDFAEWLASFGFNVYTFDYRGIGQSRPEKIRNLLADMKDWSKDIDALVGHIARIHPRSQFVIIGHSVGGQLIGMSQLSRHADALIMVGSQTPYWKHFEGFWHRVKLICFWNILIPVSVRTFGFFPASLLGLFEDLPRNVALQWARWARSSNYIFDELPESKKNFESLRQRALMISFSDDELAPPRAVADLQRFYANAKFDNWHFRPEDILQKRIGHFGFFKKRMQQVLWRDVVGWIHKTLSAPTKRAA